MISFAPTRGFVSDQIGILAPFFTRTAVDLRALLIIRMRTGCDPSSAHGPMNLRNWKMVFVNFKMKNVYDCKMSASTV